MDYSDDKLIDELNEIEIEKENIKDYDKYIEVWKKYLKIDENINLLLPDEILILSKFDFRDPKDVPHPPYKYPRINFLVFDDLVGDAHAFKLKRVIQLWTTFVSNIDIYNVIYSIKAIPPVLRRNLDIFVIFKFANVQSVEEQIFPEISAVIKKKILKLYLNIQH